MEEEGKKTEEEGRRRKAGEERKDAKSRKRREGKIKKKEVYSTSPSGGNQVDGLPPVQHCESIMNPSSAHSDSALSTNFYFRFRSGSDSNSSSI